MPAIPAAMAKASSLVRETLMPAAAAARSLARTARNRRPVPLRRRLATATAQSTRTTNTKMANAGRSSWPLSPVEDRLTPKNDAGRTFAGAPALRSVSDWFSRYSVCREIAKARVTTASWTPRMRTAGESEEDADHDRGGDAEHARRWARATPVR